MAYYRFNEFKLPSGRWMKIELSSQDYRSSPVSTPFLDTPVDCAPNPWAEGGIPSIEEEGAPDTGMLGASSVEFTFHNIYVNGTQTLDDILRSIAPESYIWHIRVWTRTGASYGADPDFWGIIESSEQSGEAVAEADKTWLTFRLTARNILALGERISVNRWLSAHLTRTYDITPSNGVWIDGWQLYNIFHDDGTTHGYWVKPFPSSQGLRFFRLVDVIYTISEAMGITRPINDQGQGAGSVAWYHTWEYIYNDGSQDYFFDFDDLCIVSTFYHSISQPGGNPPINGYDFSWTFFDPSGNSTISVYKLGNILEALKQFLVPFGLTASVRVNGSGQRYLEVREVEWESGEFGANELEGIEYTEGMKSALGMRVVTANNGEIVDGESGDKSIDNPFMGLTRIRFGERWTHNQSEDTDDLACLFGGLYIYDQANNKMLSVSKIQVRRSGFNGLTTRDAPGWGSLCYPTSTTFTEEAASVVAKACLCYYWNGLYPESADTIGIFRRYTRTRRWKESGIAPLDLQCGHYKTVSGAQWRLRKIQRDYLNDLTEFEGERQVHNA